MAIFDELSKLNVNDKTEKKKTGSTELTYLSWTYAISEITKRHPDMKYEVRHWDGKPYLYDENLGYMIETSVTIEGDTKVMWLPVMDGANKAMKAVPYTYKVKEYKNYKWTGNYVDKIVEAATMMDINKTIMRCLVKNMAMFGLGIYIYAGEDLPEAEEPPKVSEAVAKVIKENLSEEMLTKTLKRYKVSAVEDLTAEVGGQIMQYIKSEIDKTQEA